MPDKAGFVTMRAVMAGVMVVTGLSDMFLFNNGHRQFPSFKRSLIQFS
jgi:hypothetical protein